jgi:hypothetical protein
MQVSELPLKNSGRCRSADFSQLNHNKNYLLGSMRGGKKEGGRHGMSIGYMKDEDPQATRDGHIKRALLLRHFHGFVRVYPYLKIFEIGDTVAC